MKITNTILAIFITLSAKTQNYDSSYLQYVVILNKDISSQNVWTMCSNHSSFLKCDTLEFYNKNNKLPKTNCHYYLSWKFTDLFHLEDGTLDKTTDPPEVIVYLNKENQYEIKYSEEKGYAVLYISNNNSFFKYRVLSIDKFPFGNNDGSFRLRLKRDK